MGFLDHSTNNIIVDAVLTDYGREKLATAGNTTGFIYSYVFSDDEIDYSLIKKYGTTVGKEKIEKNTPIFEAPTSNEFGVTYYLSTVTNPSLAQPTIAMSTNRSVVDNTNSSFDLSLNLSTSLGGEVPSNSTFEIRYDSRFIQPQANIQVYAVPNNIHRKKVLVDTTGENLQNTTFTRVQSGSSHLAANETQKITNVYVKSDAGPQANLDITVSYA